MRSKTALVEAATCAGVPINTGWHREQIMDALREAVGTFDPDLQIDPAKAQDLKHKIAWGTSDPFSNIEDYLTPEWTLEPKLDGARMRVFLDATKNTMNTGRRSDVTYRYTERADNFPHLRDSVIPNFANTIIDGELMPPKRSITTVSGVTTVGTLNSAMALVNVNPADSVKTQKREGKAIFVAFDVLAVKGEPVMNLPFSERRKLLEEIIGQLAQIEPAFQMTMQMDATAENAQKCLDEGFEGAMLKKLDAKYQPGKRMATWQKIKKMSTGDFFIIGSVDGKGRNAGYVGSLKVAYLDEDGKTIYCADVAGITDSFRAELTDTETGQVKDSYIGKVIEVSGQGRTKNRRIRHPNFVTLRPDKQPTDCRTDQFLLFEEV